MGSIFTSIWAGGLVHRLQAVILSFMNKHYCFTKWLPGALICVILLFSACSTAQEAPPAEAVDKAAAAAAEKPKAPAMPTDPDVMLHVFTAETLGAAGDVAGAASEYLKAALISSDPEIAERATRVAVSADEWQLAVLASDRWAMLAPDSLDAHQLAAGARLKEGDYVGAEFQLTKILELTSSDPVTGWQLVTSLLAPAGDRERTNKVMDNLVQKFGGESDADALFARSQLAAMHGDLDSATRLVDRAIVIAPGRSDLLSWAGRLAVNVGNQSLALKRYRESWQAAPDDPKVAMSYAELLKRNQDLKTALTVLSQLPDSPDMRFARLVFALDAGDRDSAEKLYQGFAGAAYEDQSATAFQAAQSAELLGLTSEAISWYEKVSGENLFRAVMRRAFLWAELGEVEEGRNLLAQMRMQSEPAAITQSYLAEAQILQAAGRNQQAADVLTEGLDSFPENLAMRYSRALLAVSLGRIDVAESDLRLIIEAEPENAAAINALGYTLADLTERFDEAEELIQRAYELQPDDPSIIDSMGWISYRLGRLKEAERYLREAWSQLRNAEIAAHLGEVLYVQGQKDEARSLWRLALELEDQNEVLVSTMQKFGEWPQEDP
jgi:tetratricopeptide (TPR) repeat protein